MKALSKSLDGIKSLSKSQDGIKALSKSEDGTHCSILQFAQSRNLRLWGIIKALFSAVFFSLSTFRVTSRACVFYMET